MLRLVLFAAVVLAVAACSEQRPDEAVALAPAGTFNALADDGLGVNENGKGLAVGTQLGSVTVKTVHGRHYELSDAWAEKPALIIFYRGGWCPYCNGQVKQLSDEYDKLQQAGLQPVLISVDKPGRSALVDAEYDIPFPVLSDAQLAAHKLFNVVLKLDAKTLVRYKQYGVVPQQWSGEDHNSIGVSSAFFVDTQGVVRLSHAPADFRVRPSVDQLVAAAALLNL